MSVPARRSVGVGSGIQLAAQPVQLAALVMGETERGVERVGQSLTSAVGFASSTSPGSVVLSSPK